MNVQKLCDGLQSYKEGTLQTDCASERPRGSSLTQAKPLDLRTIVEKEVRGNVAPVSSTVEMRRFHNTSRVTASKRVILLPLGS
jgi:hypothetical protein